MATTKKRGLNRGLDALLGQSAAKTGAASLDSERYRDALPVHLIERSRYQPRKDMKPEALSELADSIRAQGIMQPVVVRPIAEGRYELIAGERRWRAAQMAGLDAVPAVIRDVEDQAAMALALIENIQREDLNPVEEAISLKRLQEEFELTQQQVAEAVGKSRVTVTNLMRLLHLEPDVLDMLQNGDLEMGHARALLGVSAREQVTLARQVVAHELTVRQTEALVRRAAKPKVQSVPAGKDPDTRRLEEELSEGLGAAVSIEHSRGGKGKVVIRYADLDELDGLLSRFRIS